MYKLFETIISKFKKEVGKSKQMTAREIKLIEICYQEMVVKNCNAPAVSKSVEPVDEGTLIDFFSWLKLKGYLRSNVYAKDIIDLYKSINGC